MPRNIATETIRSDSNPHTTYTVTLHDGKATYCTCPHGRKWSRKTSCKHMRRAEKVQDFRAAKRALKAEKNLSEELFLKFFRQATRESGVDGAIDRVLAAHAAQVATISPDVPVVKVATSSAEIPCPRCAGRGIIPCFSHVEGGICFQCKGACMVPAYDSHEEIDPDEARMLEWDEEAETKARTGMMNEAQEAWWEENELDMLMDMASI